MDLLTTFKFALQQALEEVGFSAEKQEIYINKIVISVINKTFSDKINTLSENEQQMIQKYIEADDAEKLANHFREIFNLQEYGYKLKKNFADMYNQCILTISKKASNQQKEVLFKMQNIFNENF